MKKPQKRFKPPERKAQIIEATKELILEKGLAWASVIRISEALDISQATLYYHFKNRREILLATFASLLNESFAKIISNLPADNAEEFIRQGARAFYKLTLADSRQARLMFEFICAPATEDLREEIANIISGTIDIIEENILKGVRGGTFRADLDVTVTAWKIVSLGIALNIGILLQMPNFLSMKQALSAVEDILAEIKTSH